MAKDNWHSRFDAVYEFGKYWEKKGKFRWFGENIAIFEAEIEYEAKGHIRSVATTCHLTHDGKIELIEEGWLNHIDHYLGFDISWQKMTLTSDHELQVEGSGPKMPGTYVVRIKPA